jgi:hypothetical protein
MELPTNFEHVTNMDGVIYGRHNKVTNINPYNCYFIAKYPDGSIIKGDNLIKTGWDDIPNGLVSLSYFLSTGHIINIPRYRAYMPLIECSIGMDGSKVFHAINVKCLGDKEVIVNRIILKEDNISKFKIGDIIMSKEPLPNKFNKSWKYTS